MHLFFSAIVKPFLMCKHFLLISITRINHNCLLIDAELAFNIVAGLERSWAGPVLGYYCPGLERSWTGTVLGWNDPWLKRSWAGTVQVCNGFGLEWSKTGTVLGCSLEPQTCTYTNCIAECTQSTHFFLLLRTKMLWQYSSNKL